ncbi:serine hydrolase domain-containing protein [Maribacter thermophilus]|uniref:serine hydrolase domain-containing protein n=1 Tax=Maribacter thermophilus TaxID=1197874 RepID=UPI0006415722|nr:serine hydrolase domain-containing protein [Maribacter thermophilus]
MKKKIKKYVAAFVILLLSSCSNGQTSVAENGIKVINNSINKEQSELIFDNTKSLPNNTQLSIALIKNGKIDFIGTERKNDTIKLIENYRNAFEIGSITKVFTATLLSNFVSDQKITLDDNIQHYLDFNINTENVITFKQLANHTSGLPRLPSNLNLLLVDQDNPYKDYDQEKLISYLTTEMKLNQDPGVTYEYSNLGAGILGFELATISKSSYESLLQKKIFSKYKMSNSTSTRENLKTKLVGGLNSNGKTTSNWDFDVLAGGGAIFSTVEDLSKFAVAQFDTANIELTLTQKPTFKVNDNMSIGLGWHILKRKNGGELIWHNGGTGGYTSSMALDLENKNGIIILSNVSAFHEKMGNIDQLCFGLIRTLEKK